MTSPITTVWVVICNAYPEKVFLSEAAADDYVNEMRWRNRVGATERFRRPEYWRACEFELIK